MLLGILEIISTKTINKFAVEARCQTARQQPNSGSVTVTGTPNISVVVAASTDLTSAWIVLQSAVLTNGYFYFNGPPVDDLPALQKPFLMSLCLK